MKKSLVIVESPAKAKTIGKFLGKKYSIKASVGHIIDLPKSKMGIDIDNEFEPRYITIRGKGPVLSELKKEAKKADKIFLATDPDREGEAISWHLSNALNLDTDKKNRIEFNEITKDAIKKAIKNPRQINMNLVNAQQARRVLDRLVGYSISPLLWRKVKKGLSAGRVQSVVTKIICDRETEIDEFIPEEYWSIEATLNKNDKTFKSSLHSKIENNKEKKIKLNNKSETEEVLNKINKSDFIVQEVKKGTKKRKPYPPYTTSTLQQDAANRLGFATKKTMQIAQQLYEGIEIKKEGTIGLITYIRTDSIRISNEAKENCNNYILDNFGKEYLGNQNYTKKKKNNDIQDAHEAIRPSSVNRTPSSIKNYLTKDQYKLYNLIWNRFAASQMSNALYDTLSIKINCNGYIFKTSGSIIKFKGFLKTYQSKDENKDIELPELSVGELLTNEEIISNQHFTQPPARYTEASLVKILEELGIGRPATYAPTITTVLSRRYVYLENKKFRPTELGQLVTELLKEYFRNIVNEKFTADMEQNLDNIEDGKCNWKEIIKDFYKNFEVDLKKADEEIKEVIIPDEVTDIKCDKCGEFMVIKQGRYGKFLACPGYPECKNTKPIKKELGVKCPKCKGDIIERRSKKGRLFYGCNNYPECDFLSWDLPTNESCPDCNSYLVKKKKQNKEFLICSNCKYKKEVIQ